jgi:hypothetical protein
MQEADWAIADTKVTNIYVSCSHETPCMQEADWAIADTKVTNIYVSCSHETPCMQEADWAIADTKVTNIYVSCSHETLYMQEADWAIADIKVTSERLKEALAVPEPPPPVLQTEVAEDEEMYFQQPQQLMNLLQALEEQNLFLVQTGQEVEEELDALRAAQKCASLFLAYLHMPICMLRASGAVPGRLFAAFLEAATKFGLHLLLGMIDSPKFPWWHLRISDLTVPSSPGGIYASQI